MNGMYRAISMKQWVAGLLVLLLCLCMPVCAFAVPNTANADRKINITLTIQERITDSYYMKCIAFSLPKKSFFSDLMDACVQKGYIQECNFEEDILESIVFSDRTSFAKGDYGVQSGFFLQYDKKVLLPFADFKLKDKRHYALEYKMHPDDISKRLKSESVVSNAQFKWDGSWEAVLDGACSWLYHNRTRGSAQAVTALGVARQTANPEDVSLLTYMQDQKYSDLPDLVEALYGLTYCGYGHPVVNGENLVMRLANCAKPDTCKSSLLCDILQLYDTADHNIPNEVLMSRNAIIQTLLSRQNEDGGFSQVKGAVSSIRATAKVISVLQPYRELKVVDSAVFDGISYLLSPQPRNLLFDHSEILDCTMVAQMLVAICSADLPMNDVYLTSAGVTYADLLRQYVCVSGGFSKRPGGEADENATAAAIIAMYALKTKKNPYIQDMVLVPLVINVDHSDESMVQEAQLLQAPQRKINKNFSLAVGCVIVLIGFEVVRYIIYRRKQMQKESKDE